MPINRPNVFNVVGDAVVSGGSGGAVDSVTGGTGLTANPTSGDVVLSHPTQVQEGQPPTSR